MKSDRLMNNLNNLSKQQLIKLVKEKDHSRRLAWRKYFALLEKDVVEYRDILVEVEKVVYTDDIPVHFINTFKELVIRYKHNYECVICLSNMKPDNIAVTNKCGHIFCKNCLETWKETHNTCPNCRLEL